MLSMFTQPTVEKVNVSILEVVPFAALVSGIKSCLGLRSTPHPYDVVVSLAPYGSSVSLVVQ
jgi:hypothetical protein